MKAAFDAAGYVPPPLALRDAIAVSIAEARGDVEAAVLALRGRLAADPVLLTEAARQAIGRALDENRKAAATGRGGSDANTSIARAAAVGGGGHTSADAQSMSIAPSPDTNADNDGAGQRSFDAQGIGARPVVVPQHQRRLPRAASAAVASAVARSILDMHRTELGKPVGDCSRDELVALERRSRRYAWFYAALAQEIPVGANGAAREYHTPARADALWRRAQEETGR